jgi:hypothetical protein
MYTRMATMVAEQGEIISRIDDDMDVAYVPWLLSGELGLFSSL